MHLLGRIAYFGFLFALMCCLVSPFASAQGGATTIRGTVTDAQGGAVAQAKVSLSSAATGFSRTQQTSSTGHFSFELVPVGDYDLAVEASGFRKAEFHNVHGSVDNVSTIDVRLEVGSQTEVIQVESSPADIQVNTQDATLGNNIVAQQILQLPMEARNVQSLLTLQAGVTPDGYVAGARSDQSNITLDGIDINEAQSNDIGSPVLRLNSEAVEEFRVTTVNANANEGRSSAAQINLVSKSGTNSWHGAAFEFYRGTLFEANDFFSNAAGVDRTPLVRNTFGGAIGGPIIKNKLFFFYSYEGRRDATAKPVTEIVPLPSLGQGIINYTYCVDPDCNSVAPASLNMTQLQQVYADSGLNSTALTTLADAAAKYPANDTSIGDGLNTGGYRWNAPAPVSLNSHYAKLDYVLNKDQNIFVRLNYINDTLATAQGYYQYFPDTVAPSTWSHPTGIAIGHTWSINSNLVNNFRFGLTRQAFTEGGDSFGNDLGFRFVFYPNNQIHSLSRVTPVYHWTDDLSWIHGRHVFQFGANIRKINNERTSFANSFDNAITNPSFYQGAGETLSDTFQAYLDDQGLPGDENAGQLLNSSTEVQNAATAIIGRLSQYTANFIFGRDGSLLVPGTPTNRNFATQAYDGYFQDSWKIRPHLTLTYGLRYSLERPVYETQGYEVQPEVPLTTFFKDRLAAANQGANFTDPIVINLSGPANGGKPMYNWDKNNFQPRIAVAWSPDYSSGLLGSLFGSAGQSVIRAGFALTNDYYGQALAVDFDLNNTLGFSSNYTTPANTYGINTGELAPLFTGFNQDIHGLPNVEVPDNLVFPLQQPSDYGERIESSIDSSLKAPMEYVWNLTFERQFKSHTTLSFSYIGRSARHLLARRDVAAFNNIRDPKSGMDWYTAGTILEQQRQKDVDTSQITSIPFFDNLFPSNLAELFNVDADAGFPSDWTPTQVFYGLQSRGGGGHPTNPYAFFAGNDWTDAQAYVDLVLADFGLPTRFMQPQYGALSAWSTIGNSNYNALAITLRERTSFLTMDVNYTFSHSLDDASGLQSGTAYGAGFIQNPIRQGDWYGSSDFDIRHMINASAVWQLPFGRGHKFLSDGNAFVQAVLGGWQLSGIYRWNTGLPTVAPYDDARWATNWNVQNNVSPLGRVGTCPTRKGTPDPEGTGSPKLFGGCDLASLYQTFRNSYPGETGPRNWLRAPGYMNVDLGLGKTFQMPWSENHQLQFRWEVFNVANFQPFGTVDSSRSGMGVVRDPGLRKANPPSNWSNFTAIQGAPRVMQVGLRYSF